MALCRDTRTTGYVVRSTLVDPGPSGARHDATRTMHHHGARSEPTGRDVGPLRGNDDVIGTDRQRPARARQQLPLAQV
ncbi:hypothetical protein [Massilia sp.]|uniref:hypothetical protein n=1 Tax=Massilia sp. TaxID=1882437 RepID=UPI00352EF58C